MTTHTAVWIDHREAKVFHVSPEKDHEVSVTAPQHVHRRHPKGESGAKEHPDDAARFFQSVARSLDDAQDVLVVGPSTAKLDFLRYLHKHEHALESRVVGIETVDHPTDGQLAAYARKYFKVDASA